MNPAAALSTLRKTCSAWSRSRVSGLPIALAALVFALLLPSCNLLLGLGMAKLQFGCLPEGSLIDTPTGPVRIEDLKSGDTVTGFGGEPVCISQIHQYQENPATSRYLTVHFANSSSVSASPRHRIDGIRAVDLKTGDRCGAQTVCRVDELRGVSRSFDLLTSDAGYSIAGIPVNSMIEEMLGR